MKAKSALAIATLALTVSGALADVTITPRKQTYKRPKPIADHKRTFTVTWPKVKASSVAIARKIEAALSYEKAFDFMIADEIREIQWLESATFEVLYNKGAILCVALSIEGSGAYPDGSTKYVVVDTRTGIKQTPMMVFTNLNGLAAVVAADQKKEIADAIKEIRKDPDLRDPDPSSLFTDSNLTAEDLNEFSVNAKGVTFYYDYGFPHVIQSLQPAGEFSYSWSQMKPYLKAGGLLAAMGR